MQEVGQRVKDRVDIRVGEELLVGAVGARNPVLGGVGAGRIKAAAGDRDRLDFLRTNQLVVHPQRIVKGGRDDSETQFSGHEGGCLAIWE